MSTTEATFSDSGSTSQPNSKEDDLPHCFKMLYVEDKAQQLDALIKIRTILSQIEDGTIFYPFFLI